MYLSSKGCSLIIVVHDRDGSDAVRLCEIVGEQLKGIEFKGKLNLIPTEEIEAWLLCDADALHSALAALSRGSRNTDRLARPEPCKKVVKQMAARLAKLMERWILLSGSDSSDPLGVPKPPLTPPCRGSLPTTRFSKCSMAQSPVRKCSRPPMSTRCRIIQKSRHKCRLCSRGQECHDRSFSKPFERRQRVGGRCH